MPRNATSVCAMLLALLIVSPRPADGQVRLAVSGGRTVATLEGDDAVRPFGADEAILDTERGVFAGASVSLPLGGFLSISPGLYFVQKGASFRNRQRGSVELSYIQVPVTIDVALASANGSLGVRLFGGPEVGFEVGCDLETSGFNIDLFYRQFEDCVSLPDEDLEGGQRKSTDVGLVLGGEVSYGSFLVRGGLDVGLTSLDDSGADEDFRNRAWFLGAGFVIGG